MGSRGPVPQPWRTYSRVRRRKLIVLPVAGGYCEGCDEIYTGRGLCPIDPEHTVIEVDLANERLVASVIAHSRARREREGD